MSHESHEFTILVNFVSLSSIESSNLKFYCYIDKVMSKKRTLREIKEDLGIKYIVKVNKVVKRSFDENFNDDNLVEDESLFEDIYDLRAVEQAIESAEQARESVEQAIKSAEQARDLAFLERDRIAEMNEQLSKHSLRKLWDRALPTLTFTKEITSEKSVYLGEHKEALVAEGNFSVIEDIDQLISTNLDVKQSLTLGNLSVNRKGGSYRYANETELASFVKDVIKDVLAICGYTGFAKVRQEVSFKNLENSNNQRIRPDIWVIEICGYPRLVIEVISPSRNLIVTEGKVCGQLFDYLLNMQSFSGGRAIGIITDARNGLLDGFKMNRL